MDNLINKHNLAMENLALSIENDNLSNKDASFIIENVLDTLREVGNGSYTDDELHKSTDLLIALRDKWLDKLIAENEELFDVKHWVSCLEAAGYDNWVGYEIAQEMMGGDEV